MFGWWRDGIAGGATRPHRRLARLDARLVRRDALRAGAGVDDSRPRDDQGDRRALGSATLIASAAGGMIFGIVADRYGRTRALMASVLIYSVFTAACGLAQTRRAARRVPRPAWLGMGGEWASGAALVSETWPAEHRGKALGFMQSALGDRLRRRGDRDRARPAAMGLARRVLRRRAAGVADVLGPATRGGAGDLAAAPERRAPTRARGVAATMRSGARLGSRRLTIAVTFMNAFTMFGWWGFNLWLPGYLSLPVRPGGMGFAPPHAGLIVAMQVGMWFGYVTFGFISDAIGRKRAYVIYTVTRGGTDLRLYLGPHADRTPAARTIRGVLRHRLLQRIRRGDGRDLSDRYSRHGAGLHLQHRPDRQRDRAVRRRLARPDAGSMPRCRSRRSRSCSRP